MNSPRILLCANNWGGWQITKHLLHECWENIVGLVIHPPGNQKFTQEIVGEFIGQNRIMPIILWADLVNAEGSLDIVRGIKPDILISAFFGYILGPEILAIPPMGCVNLHPAFLPTNRGWHPNVYPILDGSPAGATIHYMDEGIDTGDIIAQTKVQVLETDTGRDLHRRCTFSLVGLFKWEWPRIRSGKNTRTPQQAFTDAGAVSNHHYRREMREIEQVDLDKTYRAGDLINLIRANTYPPYPGAYFLDKNGERVYMRMKLLREGDLEGGLPKWPMA